MKLKNLTMLTLGVSALMGSVSANADVTSSVSSWSATANVETSARLTIVQTKQTLLFNYHSTDKTFTTDKDTLRAILRSGSTVSSLNIDARLKSNTLSNGTNKLFVNAEIGGKALETAKAVNLFKGNTTDIFGGIISDDYLKDTFTGENEASEKVTFTIPQQTTHPAEGQYIGDVDIEFNATWTE